MTYRNRESEDSSLNYHSKIKKQVVITFQDKKKAIKPRSIVADEGESFADILCRYDGKILDYEFLVRWPITKAPWMICDEEEKSRCVSKPVFRNHLQNLNPIKPRTEVTGISIYIVDAMKIVRMISPSNMTPSTFETWTVSFYNYINRLPGNVSHIVFDIYSLNKDFAYPSKGRYNPESVGERRYISDLSQQLPFTIAAWNNYLSNDQNKRELTNLMIDYLIGGKYKFNRPVYVTKEKKSFLIQNGTSTDVPELFSNHKEADPRLALHAVYASSIAPNEAVCVVCDDTDVFIILLSIATQMKGDLFFRQGRSTGKGLEYHNVRSLAEKLGDECCKNLPAFHALTGCDFTYPFYRRSKYQSFVNMMNLKNSKSRRNSVGLLDSLGTLEPDVKKISDFVIHTMYNRPIKENSLSESRSAMLFVKQKGKKRFRSTTQIPPDENSLKMKILRCNLIAYGWRNCLNERYEPLDPCQSGLFIRDGFMHPIWYNGSNLPTDE